MDMTGNYKLLVIKLCPNAEVTVNKFSVIKIVQSELNQAIIDQNKTASSLNVKERAQVFGSLKGSKYTLLKAEHKLSNKKNKISKRSFTDPRNYALIKIRISRGI
jgi:transposase